MQANSLHPQEPHDIPWCLIQLTLPIIFALRMCIHGWLYCVSGYIHIGVFNDLSIIPYFMASYIKHILHCQNWNYRQAQHATHSTVSHATYMLHELHPYDAAGMRFLTPGILMHFAVRFIYASNYIVSHHTPTYILSCMYRAINREMLHCTIWDLQ